MSFFFYHNAWSFNLLCMVEFLLINPNKHYARFVLFDTIKANNQFMYIYFDRCS